jgi:hypothetical protein
MQIVGDGAARVARHRRDVLVDEGLEAFDQARLEHLLRGEVVEQAALGDPGARAVASIVAARSPSSTRIASKASSTSRGPGEGDSWCRSYRALGVHVCYYTGWTVYK